MSFENSRNVGYAEIGRFVAAVRRAIAPRRDGRRAVVYPFASVDFLGHLWFDPHVLRTLFPPDRHQVFFVRPPLPAKASTEGAAIATRGLEVVELTELPPQLLFRLAATIFYDQARFDFGDLHVVFGGASRVARELYHHATRGQPQRASVSLTEAEEAEGARLARNLGIDPARPIVVLHVREGGYNAAHDFNRFRDCDVSTYRPAVAAMARRGYTVLRIGDATMRALEVDHPLVHDVARIPGCPPLLDLWAIARAAFVIHCCSGPADVARAFGRPLLGINGYIGDYSAFESPHVLLPKRIEEVRTGRPLDYAEMFGRGLMALSFADQLDLLGLRMVAADPAAIEATCLAFADRLGGEPGPPTRYEVLNEREGALRRATGGRLPEQRFWAVDLPGSVLAEAFLERQPGFVDRDVPPPAERAPLPEPMPLKG